MNKEIEVLIEIIRDFCENEYFAFRNDYSGRCMYGRECIGFEVCTLSEGFEALVKLTELLIENDIEDVSGKLASIKCDNFGENIIIYFPTLKTDK